MTLLNIFYILILNFIYFFISQKIKISKFFYYFIGFIFYTLIIFIIISIIKLNLFFDQLISFIYIYIFFFISFFLSMSVKYIRSPSFLIFKYLSKKRKKKEIVKYLESQHVLKRRFDDLIDQKIILVKNNNVGLNKKFFLVIKILYIIKIFFNLKSEG